MVQLCRQDVSLSCLEKIGGKGMKFIEQSCEIWPQGYDMDDVWKHIERCGRVCYQSDKPSEDSKKWCMSKIKAGHMSILEHGTIYLDIPRSSTMIADFFIMNKYSHVNHIIDNYYVTTNMRVIVENGMYNALAFLCPLTQYHTPRYTISIITDLAVAREFNRHRVQSISEESTRYCNYSKGKFDNELKYIKPVWITENPSEKDVEALQLFNHLLKWIEDGYMNLLEYWTPEQARRVLPLGLKVQTVHTASIDNWKDFLNKRALEKTGKVDPNMKDVALKIKHLLEQ